MNNFIKISFYVCFLLIFSNCEKDITKSDNIFDDQLIQDIIDAEKIEINISDLPSSSINLIEKDYSDYIDLDVEKASGLGYQVSMDGKDYKTGYHNELYFNLNGRELKSEKRRKNKDGFQCFELILPIIFMMPDASSIVVQDDDDYSLLKNWYQNNSGFNDKPLLQYPIDIIYKNGDIETISNDQEMIRNKMSCRDWDDKNKYDCFNIVYPISFTMLDGSTISMSDEGDWGAIKSWYEQNPDTDHRPELQYPITIINKDNSSTIINNDEEMSSLKENCRN